MKRFGVVATALMVCVLGASAFGFGAASERFSGECPGTRNPLVGFPDGLPMFGQTSRQRVEGLAQDLASIQQVYPGILQVSVERRGGQVWDREPSGEIIIRMPDDDYWLVAWVKRRRACPTSPVSWNGVPMRFVVSECVGVGEPTATVPDVIGFSLSKAIRTVESSGLHVVGDGTPRGLGDPVGPRARVIAQEPGGGSAVPRGACVGFRTEN